MTASGTGAPGRDTTTDDASRRGFGREILAVIAIGLVLRLIMAYGVEGLRGSGFGADLGLFRYWADLLAQYGPPGFYANASYADYTPGYLYALWPVGIVGQWIGGVGDLIKLPAIITDAVLALVVYRMVLDLGVTERRATLAALVVIANPITWFDSVIWGQVDSFGTVFLLLAIRELWKNRTERAAILAVVAALVKPQLGILVPIIAVVTIRRALWPSGGFGNEAPPRPSGLGWERRAAGPIRILTTGVAGLPDRGADGGPVRAVGGGAHRNGAVRGLVPAPAGVQHGRHVSLRDGERLQPVGAVPRERPEHGDDGRLAVRRAGGSGVTMGRHRAYPGRADRGSAAARARHGDLGAGRATTRPADDPGRGLGACDRLLRRPDARPRALPVPPVRARRDPDRLLLALADRLPDRRRRDIPQHVRRPDHDLPGQPVGLGLARHRRGDPVVLGGGDHRHRPHGGPGLDPRAAETGRAAGARGGGGQRPAGSGGAPGRRGTRRGPAERRSRPQLHGG